MVGWTNPCFCFRILFAFRTVLASEFDFLSLHWKVPFFAGLNSDAVLLSEFLESLDSSGRDILIWKLPLDGAFSVCTFHNLFTDDCLCSPFYFTIWSCDSCPMPLKSRFFFGCSVRRSFEVQISFVIALLVGIGV